MEKKRHTNKALFAKGSKKHILYLSELYTGNSHDFEILKDCFAAEENWFEKFKVRLDLGFQGFTNLYTCKKAYLPIKRKRVKKGCSNELTDKQKQINKKQAKERVSIEHSIGGMKRFQILSNRIRIKDTGFLNIILGVCAGLWNFMLNQ